MFLVVPFLSSEDLWCLHLLLCSFVLLFYGYLQFSFCKWLVIWLVDMFFSIFYVSQGQFSCGDLKIFLCNGLQKIFCNLVMLGIHPSFFFQWSYHLSFLVSINYFKFVLHLSGWDFCKWGIHKLFPYFIFTFPEDSLFNSSPALELS